MQKLTAKEVEKLEAVAAKRREDAVTMVYNSKTGHIGGTLSSLDILTALYYNVMDTEKIKAADKNRDYFIMSKGHCVEGLYSILADLGFFPKDELATYGKYSTRLACHPTKKVNGIEVNTGSLGHGLPIAVGIALAKKRDKLGGRVFVLMGDGEQCEGSIWEACMAASNYKLDNICIIVDRNGLQISGKTKDVMDTSLLESKYTSFGFNVTVINGHSYPEIIDAMEMSSQGKPTAIIADTIKGKGVSFMENNKAWHHKVPSQMEFELAIKELGV